MDAKKLREFRHKVSVLKKQGLIPGRTDAGLKLDARSVTQDWKVRGKKLSTLVSKYDDVASGKATALQVTPTEAKRYRKAGFETTSTRVIVPHAATEKARKERGEVVLKNKSGIERIQIPVEYHNVEDYLRSIKEQRNAINRLKHRNEYFGIRFRGGQRAFFFSDIEDLIEHFEQYEVFQSATTRRKQQEVFKHLEIVRITRQAAREIESRQRTHKETPRTKAYYKKTRKRYLAKLRRDPKRYADFKRMRAEQAKRYRSKLKGSRKQDYQKKARKRAKKWYKKNVK